MLSNYHAHGAANRKVIILLDILLLLQNKKRGGKKILSSIVQRILNKVVETTSSPFESVVEISECIEVCIAMKNQSIDTNQENNQLYTQHIVCFIHRSFTLL